MYWQKKTSTPDKIEPCISGGARNVPHQTNGGINSKQTLTDFHRPFIASPRQHFGLPFFFVSSGSTTTKYSSSGSVGITVTGETRILGA
jgi:hypothetical protein